MKEGKPLVLPEGGAVHFINPNDKTITFQMRSVKVFDWAVSLIAIAALIIAIIK
jgi:hypothetical protein